mgnify:CR=1 FL=1
MSQQSYTIGELARRSGVAARKIRFYADAGLLSPLRTEAGYRIFDDRDVIALDLIQALRGAGVGLPDIQAVLRRDTSIGEMLSMRLMELEASIGRQKALSTTLRLALASGSPTIEDLHRISQMIEHTRQQRHLTASAFMKSVTGGVAVDDRWRVKMQDLISAPDLPDEPSPEQLDAWLRVNELLSDERLQRVLRAQATDTGRTETFLRARDNPNEWHARQDQILAQVGSVMRRQVPVSSPEAEQLADTYIAFMAWNRGEEDDATFRSRVRKVWADHGLLEEFWRQIAILNGHQHHSSAEYEWLAQATARRLDGTAVAFEPDPG